MQSSGGVEGTLLCLASCSMKVFLKHLTDYTAFKHGDVYFEKEQWNLNRINGDHNATTDTRSNY